MQKQITKIQNTFGIYENYDAQKILDNDFISVHSWTSANMVDGKLLNESDLYISDDSDDYNVYQFNDLGEPKLIGTWESDQEVSPSALDKWIMSKNASKGGKKSAEARKGKTDYSALALKRWNNHS